MSDKVYKDGMERGICLESRFDTLKKSEQVAFLLRNIYEQYGYEQFCMGKFEEYDFYTENKDFLPSAQILTFTDLSGKLMALKPDVTMSIVKRTRATLEQPDRLYYHESIYRASQEVKEYKEIRQVGVEYIGRVGVHTNAEIVAMALKSLACISEEYVLDISHMGFLSGYLKSLAAPKEFKKAFLKCLESKNTHELIKAMGAYDIPDAGREGLLMLLVLDGDMKASLEKAETLVINEEMRQALEELKELHTVFSHQEKNLRLDFSISLGSKYYNGLMLRGYVKKAPRAVLSGGRYDPLLRRMGKDMLEAIGFAIYIDEVERYLESRGRNEYDIIMLYDENTSAKALYSAAEQWLAQGKRIYMNTGLPETGWDKHTKKYRLAGDRLEEIYD